MNVAITHGRVNGVGTGARESDDTPCAPTSSNSGCSLGSAHSAMRAQEFFAALGDRYPDACSRHLLARDVAAIDRVLPDPQPRTRGAPGLDHLGIQPRLPRHPLDKI